MNNYKGYKCRECDLIAMTNMETIDENIIEARCPKCGLEKFIIKREYEMGDYDSYVENYECHYPWYKIFKPKEGEEDVS